MLGDVGRCEVAIAFVLSDVSAAEKMRGSTSDIKFGSHVFCESFGIVCDPQNIGQLWICCVLDNLPDDQLTCAETGTVCDPHNNVHMFGFMIH